MDGWMDGFSGEMRGNDMLRIISMIGSFTVPSLKSNIIISQEL